MKTKITLTYWT